MNKHHWPVGNTYPPTGPTTRGAKLPFDAVLFDLYGTLVDETTGTPERRVELDRVTQEIAAVLGAPQDPFMALWSSTVAQRATGVHGSFEAYVTALCGELGVAPSADSAAEAFGLRVDFFRDRLDPRPDALDTLAAIRAKGLSVGLISNCSWATEMLWPSTPFPPHFDAAILSCEVGMRKPDPAIYALACSRLGVAHERCLFVGDGRSGELPRRRAGRHDGPPHPRPLRVLPRRQGPLARPGGLNALAGPRPAGIGGHVPLFPGLS